MDTPQDLNDWMGIRTPDGRVALRYPQTWKQIAPISDGACLALNDAAGSVLVEVMVADAPSTAAMQPTDVTALAKIAYVTINGLREVHPDLRVLRPPVQLSDWTEGICVHFITAYVEAVVIGKRVGSVTDSFLIGKGAKFVHLNIKCEESLFKTMVPVNASIARSVTLLSGTAGQAKAAQPDPPVCVERPETGASAQGPPHTSAESGTPQDPTVAEALAAQGSLLSQYHAAVMYDTGEGAPPDKGKAAYWYRKAAEQDLPQAQANLGYLYAHGQGVAQDYTEARRWFQRAADQGFADGEFKLGILYANGWGVNRDYDEAFKWVSRAARQGHADAQAALETITRRGVQQGIARGGVPVRQPLDKEQTIREMFLGLFILALLPACGLAGGIIYAGFRVNILMGCLAITGIIITIVVARKRHWIFSLILFTGYVVALLIGFQSGLTGGIIATAIIVPIVWMHVIFHRRGILRE